MAERKIGIIGAMEVEVQALRALLAGTREHAAGGLTFTEGQLDGVQVVIVRSGVGKVNAALCAQRLILQFGVTHIINTGIAGALASGLKVLDFVASTDALYHDMNAVGFGYRMTEIPQMDCSDFPADTAMLEAAEKAFASLPEAEGHKLVKGRIATGDQFISDKALKQQIKADCNPACVEMEGTAIAHACYLNKVPFVIIRCMSDMADDIGENTYSFNEQAAANLSAALVRKMLGNF
ncbi:MAG: 5'-methylthioadenosine/adenosylhomocysteine nucleosidase [Treponema sp.]|nr:5'-methylthioadenosine/adenosylhomocysteine nucleosidase [Treponema sp.]